jgi:5-methylthioadenosine/S-adenosylhomocysteine deaminase
MRLAAPHSIYTCSKKTLQDAAALARKYHAPILIHVAEMKKEWEDSEKANGMSPVQYLEKIGVLGPDIVAAHCIFVDQADRKLLAERGTGCVHNPSSNMMIASGVSPVPEMRAAGVAVGLGTDGPAGSNNDLDLMEEIDLAAKLAKDFEDGSAGAGREGCCGDGHDRWGSRACTWRRRLDRSRPARKLIWC